MSKVQQGGEFEQQAGDVESFLFSPVCSSSFGKPQSQAPKPEPVVQPRPEKSEEHSHKQHLQQQHASGRGR